MLRTLDVRHGLFERFDRRWAPTAFAGVGTADLKEPPVIAIEVGFEQARLGFCHADHRSNHVLGETDTAEIRSDLRFGDLSAARAIQVGMRRTLTLCCG